MAVHVKQFADGLQPDCPAARHRILALLDAPQRLANLRNKQRDLKKKSLTSHIIENSQKANICENIDITYH
jgi:hypothetical protein